jgi:hypothetical protein
MNAPKTPTPQFAADYERWRHGGWYNHSAVYPSGATGCVSNNYPDKRWRITGGIIDLDHLTFSSRDDAAKAETLFAYALRGAVETRA